MHGLVVGSFSFVVAVGTQRCEPIFGQRILRPQLSCTYADIVGSCTAKHAPTQMDDLCNLTVIGSHVNNPVISNVFKSTNILNKQTSDSIW